MAGLAIAVGAGGAPDTVVGAYQSGGGGWRGMGRRGGAGTRVKDADTDQGSSGGKGDGGDTGEPEVFLGEMGTSIGMIALQVRRIFVQVSRNMLSTLLRLFSARANIVPDPFS